jgi:hypothetical protein
MQAKTKLLFVAAAAVLAGACGGEVGDPANPTPGGLALVSIQPSSGGPASLSRSRPAGCAWCTTSFSAEVSVLSPSTLPGVNLWLDGWSGSRRCLTSQHDSPEDGFTLVAGRAAIVGFSQASVDCTPPFGVDRIDVRMRSGEMLVYQGSWPVSLSFVE